MRRLSSVQQGVLDDIKRQIAAHGVARFSHWQRRWQTLAVLEKRKLIDICGDEITLHGQQANITATTEP